MVARRNRPRFPKRFAEAGRPGTYLRVIHEGDIARETRFGSSLGRITMSQSETFFATTNPGRSGVRERRSRRCRRWVNASRHLTRNARVKS